MSLKPFTRIDYSGVLTVLSPLHIGSGEVRTDPRRIPDARKTDGKKKELSFSAILRDCDDAPFIPGSALKGALRATARELLAEDEVAALFGEIKRDIRGDGDMERDGDITRHGGGRAGALFVRGASHSSPGDTRCLPYPDKWGVFILARTAIRPGAGISETSRLFHAEAVAAGARFAFRLRLETRGDAAAAEAALRTILGAWTGEAGISIGSDAASGHGRVRIAGPVERRLWSVNGQSGRLEPGPAAELAPLEAAAAGPSMLLRLTCPGPFLTRDPAWTEKERDDAKKERPNREPAHLRALRLGDDPFITGQGVSGALRARLAWLEALDRHRAGKRRHEPTQAIRDAAEAAHLPLHERLFGVTGWRGVLSVTVERTRRTQALLTTSVRIDRFSAGTIDNALYAIDADRGVELAVRLAFDRRATETDRKGLEPLLDDLRRNGLELGHGVGRGFGWFKVEVVR